MKGLFGFTPGQQATAASGIGGLLGGIFGDSGAPYDAAMDQYQKWATKGEAAQNPFYSAGTGAIGNYQDWLKNMSNPTEFINNIMSNYKQSPYSRFLQQQNLRAGMNFGSASGLTGSTPLLEQMQANANNYASQDQNQWLQNVLGINTQYGQGQQNLMGVGQNAANSLTNLYGNLGQQMGEAAYGKEAGGNQDIWNMLGGAASIASMFL